MGLAEHKLAIVAARRYFGEPAEPKCLGWGISGSVFLSPRAEYAIKIHKQSETYEVESRVYRCLDRLRITEIQGLTVPRMWDSRDDLRLIRMDFVRPPYLLDFAGVLFKRPDFDDEKWQNWHDGIREAYGEDNTWIPYAAFERLKRHGMYYVDIRITNLKLNGHPDYVPPEPVALEDL